MFQIPWKNIYSTVIVSSLTLLTNCLFEGMINKSWAEASTQLDKTGKTEQLNHNKQLTNRVGQFILVYKPSPNQYHQALQQGLQEAELFETIIAGLNNSGLIMRYDIPIIFQDCGMANAFYNPQNKSIIMCHELIFQMAEDFTKIKKASLEEAFTDALFTTLFVFYHELGHALIDVLPLPTVGKEEDAVDQFSAIMLLNSENSELAINTIGNAAIWFANAPETPAWGEHAPNDVRFYNLVCLVYGSNPSQYAIFEEIIPRERAARCSNEYNKVATSWNQLLLPHFAQNTTPWGGNASRGTSPNNPSRGVRRGRIW